MEQTYFLRLAAETGTRVWVNNPSSPEVELALGQGAVGCTTNPSYSANLLLRAPDEVRPLIAACAAESEDDDRVGELVQQHLVARLVERFRPFYDASGGEMGFVSIQGSPESDDDPALILSEARAGHRLGPNAATKIPATAPGLQALEALVAEGCPSIVTEVFSLAQLIEANERYLAVAARTGTRPPFFISPITGIFGDYLKSLAKRDGIPIASGVAELAGVVLARQCYRLVRDRGYPATLLAGGARTPFDLTGLVGGALHVTLNWSTYAGILAADGVLHGSINDAIDPAAIATLKAAFNDFERATRSDGLTLGEFDAFGPVQYFRGLFLQASRDMKSAIASARREITASH